MKAILLTVLLLLSASNCKSEEVALDIEADGPLLMRQLSVYATTFPLYRRWQSECSEAYPEASEEFEAPFIEDNFSLLEKTLKNLLEKRLKIFAFDFNALSAVRGKSSHPSMSKEDCIQSISSVSVLMKSLDSNKASKDSFNKFIGFVNALNKLSDSELDEYVTAIYANAIKARKEATKESASYNKVRPSPLEKNKDFDELFNKIVNDSRKSYESGVWSIFANLYDAASFACFDGTELNDNYNYLSMFPVSEDAAYDFFTREVQGGSEFTGFSYTCLLYTSPSPRDRG